MSKIDYSAVQYVDFQARRVETLQERLDRLPTFREKLEALPPGCKFRRIVVPPRKEPAKRAPPVPELKSTFDCGPRLSTSRGRRHGWFSDDDWR